MKYSEVLSSSMSPTTEQKTFPSPVNLVNYAAIDTVVNSPSFGQVTSVRQMRSMQLVLRFRY